MSFFKDICLSKERWLQLDLFEFFNLNLVAENLWKRNRIPRISKLSYNGTRFKEPKFNEIPGTTNNILQRSQSHSNIHACMEQNPDITPGVRFAKLLITFRAR